MSKQTTVTSYFNSTAMPCRMSMLGSETINKRRSLSLKKSTTPSKVETKKKVVVDGKQEDVITLSSDDDLTPSKRPLLKLRKDLFVKSDELHQESFQSPNSSTDASNSSATTIVYNLSPGAMWQSQETPSKKIHSPGSSRKFYSPTKKRLVSKKTTVKRNLTFDENIALLEDKTMSKDYSDQDDKTALLLSIIEKFVKTKSLKHLLEEDSQMLLEKCMHIVKLGMKLVCRLYWREHGWYRIVELIQMVTAKKEPYSSPDVYNNMITCLVDNGLITPAGTEGESSMNFDEYVKRLKRPDLQQICKELKLKIQTKQDAVEALRSFCKVKPISVFYTSNVKTNHTRVLEILKSKTGLCYKMSELARTTFYNLYVLMYLGIDYTVIREKKLEWILILDKINRESYPIDKEMIIDNASVVFENKVEFNRYLQAHKLYENYLEKTETKEKCEIVQESYIAYKNVKENHMLRYKSLPTWLRRFTPTNIYVKIMESGVQELKKIKTEEYYKLAIQILDTLICQIAFRQHKKAEWYAEKAHILHSHLDSSKEAAQVLLQGFESDLSEELKDAMRPRAKKIANQQNIDLEEELREALRFQAAKEAIVESNLPGEHIYKQPMDNYNQRGKLKFEVRSDDGRSILTAEDYCLLHYVGNGQFSNGEHWEGRIVTTIFSLWFWDIIYTKPSGVSGIFISHYQRHPLDMFSESFYVNRKSQIDERLVFIENCSNDALIEMMQLQWLRRPESEISDIHHNIGWDNVRMVSACLGPRGVSAICRRLVANYGYTRSGFPDLTLWNVHTKKIKFVEVKTDRDKPSVKQLQWLQYLIEHGIDAGFCYVGANTNTRARARPCSSHDSQGQSQL